MGPLTRIQPFTNSSLIVVLPDNNSSLKYFWPGRFSVPEHVLTLVSQGPKQADPRLLGHIQSRKHKTTPDKMASLFIGQKISHYNQVNINSKNICKQENKMQLTP